MYRAIVIDDEKWTLMGICRTFHWEEEGFEQPFRPPILRKGWRRSSPRRRTRCL